MNRTLKGFSKMAVCFFSLLLFFQAGAFAESIPFDSPRWVLKDNAKIEEYLGKKSLRIHAGRAYLKDLQFTNGIIEFDVAFSEGRGFFGGFFRMQDEENYEEFYLRSHQSGNPDAFQYTPVFNGMSAWQLYHGKGFSGVAKYKFDQWMHVKLVVSGDQGELYIDNDETPVLFIHDFRRKLKPGKVGVYALRFAPGHFANFSVTPMDNPPLKSTEKVEDKTEAGTVTAWSISSAFPEPSLDKKYLLTDNEKKDLQWKPLKSELSGLANISKVVKLERPKNTVFAKITIDSKEQQVKNLFFGFSDRVKVYLNNRLLYTGNNNYRSRDYRYLGTIGYFDAVALPLKKGKNELVLAVSENFGGWGIKGRFEDMTGISIK